MVSLETRGHFGWPDGDVQKEITQRSGGAWACVDEADSCWVQMEGLWRRQQGGHLLRHLEEKWQESLKPHEVHSQNNPCSLRAVLEPLASPERRVLNNAQLNRWKGLLTSPNLHPSPNPKAECLPFEFLLDWMNSLVCLDFRKQQGKEWEMGGPCASWVWWAWGTQDEVPLGHPRALPPEQVC